MTKKVKDLYWIKSGILNILQNLSGVFFSFGSFYLLVHYLLDPHSFGAWTLFMSAVTILEIVRGGLIQGALIKFLSGADKQDHLGIISASFTITGILTIFCILINVGFALYLPGAWNSPELMSIFYWYSVAFIFSGILTLFNCIEQANLQFNGIFVSNCIRQGVFFVYLFFCFILHIKVPLLHLIYSQIVSIFLAMISAYFYTKPFLVFSFKIYSDWIKKLLDYGKYAFGTSVSAIMANTIDQMMVGAMISPAASGAFNVAIKITNLVDIPTNAIAAIVFPQSAKRIESEGKEAIKYLYEKSVGTLLAILVPCVLFLFLFSEFVVNFIAGKQYAETIPLLHVTLLYCLLIPYGRQVGIILDSIGKTKLTFYIVLTVASINIGLNYPLIATFGTMGAAYASLISAIAGFYIAKVVLRRELNVNLVNTLVYAVKFYPDFYHKYIKPSKQHD